MNDITILMPCFNKEKYISKALDSIFEQETKYKIEILIADDCSSDRTLEIVDSYKKKNLIPFTILTFEQNQGLYYNVMRAYNKITTPYFTVLDPDDYWCDKFKIQKALDFLEANKDFTIYSANLYTLKDNIKTKYFNIKKPQNYTFNDFINGNAVISQTSGTIFRNIIFSKGIPQQLESLKNFTKISSFRGDSFRNMIHLHEGKCHYDPYCGSIYQITDEGIWTSTTEIKRLMLNINLFKDMFLYFNCENIELLQTSYNLYKVILKKLPTLIAHDANITESYINELYENLASLELVYNKNKDKLKQSVKHKKTIYNFIIKITNKLYNKVIYYIE